MAIVTPSACRDGGSRPSMEAMSLACGMGPLSSSAMALAAPRFVVLVAVVSMLMGCRWKTQYREDVTAACRTEGELAYAKGRDAGDPHANPITPCKDCCQQKGFSDLDPGGCVCGKAGLDALFR